MIDHKCGLESCPAQAPLLELLRLVRHQSDLPEQSGQNGQKGDFKIAQGEDVPQ